jgi:hypothetical protein
MKTAFFKIECPCYIFQQGLILELHDAPSAGYAVPDKGDGAPGIIPADCVTFSPPPPEDLNGKCVLTQVANFYRDASKSQADGEASTGVVKKEQVRIVHYPDAQQLVFHMPKYAWDAGCFRLVEEVSDRVEADCPVKDVLNGSTQILVDTLPLRPGFYTIEADWPDGWTHQLKFIKFMAGYPKEESYQHPPGNASGVETEGMEQIREKAMKKISDAFSRRVEYLEQGRAGQITYCEGDLRINFDWEFGGGNCVVIIFVPKPEHWEAQTNTPLERRQEILEFVADRAIRDKAPSCYSRITDNWIEIIRS